jgi:glycosyltransferase involved in cell wall biosynthesis
MTGPLFTVFTPSYNRSHTLHRPYESLRRQTCRDFEWLVVDDGSTDGSAERVEDFGREAGFPVRLLVQQNRGKHIAMNRGMTEARGRFFLPLDSDDACLPDALETLRRGWEGIPESSREGFASVVGRCVYPDGRPVGRPFPRTVLDASGLEARYRWGIEGELWGFVRTEVLRHFRFPESAERTYIPESLVWDRIATRYRTRFVDRVLRVYHLESGPTSLGSPRDPARGAYGGVEQHRMVLNEQMEWFREAPAEFLRSAAHYSRFSFHLGIPWREQLGRLAGPGGRLLWALALPVGLAAFALDRRRAT